MSLPRRRPPQPGYDMIGADDPPFALRPQLVRLAQTHGLNAAARQLGGCRHPVRKWFRRFQAHGHAGLRAQSRAPQSCPHKTHIALENRGGALRQKAPGFGARRLIEEFDLPWGHHAAQRIIPPHPLARPRQRRQHRQNDRRAGKAAPVPCPRFPLEGKDLTDMPFDGPQMPRHGLPRFQYTRRALSGGAQFLAPTARNAPRPTPPGPLSVAASTGRPRA